MNSRQCYIFGGAITRTAEVDGILLNEVAPHSPENGVAHRVEFHVHRPVAAPLGGIFLPPHMVVEGGFRDEFFKLIIPATRFPNATTWILASILHLHPELAPTISEFLAKYVPNVLLSQPQRDGGNQNEKFENAEISPQVSELNDTEVTDVQE